MPFGDIIFDGLLKPNLFTPGFALAALPGSYVVSGVGIDDNDISEYDFPTLAQGAIIRTKNHYEAIQYSHDDDTYWGIERYGANANEFNAQVYHFDANGNSLGNFDAKANVPVADRYIDWEKAYGNGITLSPDQKEVLVLIVQATDSTELARVYRFEPNGSYLGYFTADFDASNKHTSSITNDGVNIWIRVDTILKKLNSTGVLIETIPIIDYPLKDYNIPYDIEFDPYNFAPDCAIVIKTYVFNAGKHTIIGVRVPCPGKEPCQEPPVIDASNQCLSVGDTFDPLANVTATDCDGTNISLDSADIIFNDVDTSKVGMYTVTYKVKSPTNGLTSTKTIYVEVVAKGPRHQAITDLIQSVALEETALSHILNAEGEKIQKIVSQAKSHEELLAVNKSVESMVCAVIKLEMVLQCKLEIFKDCLCTECQTPIVP